jgi:hypothetical protein
MIKVMFFDQINFGTLNKTEIMKYTDESKSLADVRVLSKEIGRRIRKRAKKRCEIDVRPLDQRENPLNTRKGIVTTLILPKGMTGEQLEIWQDENRKVKKPYIKPTVTVTISNIDELEPDYIKKHKSEMI